MAEVAVRAAVEVEAEGAVGDPFAAQARAAVLPDPEQLLSE